MKTDMDMTHSDGAEMDAGASDLFSRDTTGRPLATAPQVVVLQPNEVFELRAEQVRKRIGETSVKMLAYNRSIPGPTLRVAQGSEALSLRRMARLAQSHARYECAGEPGRAGGLLLQRLCHLFCPARRDEL